MYYISLSFFVDIELAALLSTKYSIERFIDDSQKVMEKNISGLYLWCKGPFNISRKKLVIFRWWCAVKNIQVLLLIFRVFAQLFKNYYRYIQHFVLNFIPPNECPGLFGAFYLIINSELWRGVRILLITYRNIQERTIHNITIES